MQLLIVVVLAFAPGIFWLWLVYRGDRYRPEPRSLVVRTFLWGMVVAIPVATLESFHKRIDPTDAEQAMRLLKKNDIFAQATLIIGERKDSA